MTAVEWLVSELQKAEYIPKDSTIMDYVIQRSKEMEMNQLEKFYNHGMFAILDGNGHGEEFIDYFKKTFKQKKL